MANGVFEQAKDDLLKGLIDWLTDDFRAILIDTGAWTPDFVLHTHLDDVPVGARVATSGAMAGKTVSGGAVDANDVTWAAVSGNVSEGVLIYRHTGVESTSALVVFYDTGVAGLPVTPDGSDITVRWNAGGVLAL
jgi:hypothetical protein